MKVQTVGYKTDVKRLLDHVSLQLQLKFGVESTSVSSVWSILHESKIFIIYFVSIFTMNVSHIMDSLHQEF